jgi:phage terminase large subunit-like protein
MSDVLEDGALSRWRQQPISFIADVLRNPEDGAPFQLLDAQREFFAHAWTRDEAGRLVYPEQCFGAIKKTGKTATAAMHLLTTTLLYGGRFAEGYAVANDLEQAQGRVFQAVRRIVEASPHLRHIADITAYRIAFPQTGATIQAIGSDYAGAAGANPVVSSFDELWAFTSERSRRLWDEMVPSPARRISCRLVTTYAGWEHESELLHGLYRRGMAQPLLGADLHGGDGLLLAWHGGPIAPWQSDAWISEMRRTLRPAQFLRMICNQWVTSESSFIDMAHYDACVDEALRPVIADRTLPVWIGLDASTKRDSTAIVAVTWSKREQHVRLVNHCIITPTAEQPVDFADVESVLLDWRRRYRIRAVSYDPYQMASSSQRLVREGVPMEECPQTVPFLTDAGTNLYDLFRGHSMRLYPDERIRAAVSRAVAIETPRGWRLGKAQQSHKIDVVTALAMAALGAVRGQGVSRYTLDSWLPEATGVDVEGSREWRARRANEAEWGRYARPAAVPKDVLEMFAVADAARAAAAPPTLEAALKEFSTNTPPPQ